MRVVEALCRVGKLAENPLMTKEVHSMMRQQFRNSCKISNSLQEMKARVSKNVSSFILLFCYYGYCCCCCFCCCYCYSFADSAAAILLLLNSLKSRQW